jgi:hypothetical protein
MVDVLDEAVTVTSPADEVVPSYTSKNTSPHADAVTEVDEDDEPKAKASRPFFTGWCGPGPDCREETRELNKSGEPVRRCRYACENGSKAPRPIVYCACSCHRDPERAGQAVDRT